MGHAEAEGKRVEDLGWDEVEGKGKLRVSGREGMV